MLQVTLDFETFYSKTFSLRLMTPVEYIMSPQFETIGCAVIINDAEPKWLEGDMVARLLRKINEPYMCISHNALFDMCILAYRYQIYPTLSADTMSMARALLFPDLPQGRVSLDNVASFMGVGQKGNEVVNAVGWNLAMFKADPERYGKYQRYACQDARLCRAIFKQLSHSFPPREFIINDMIIRMATRPKFEVDYNLLLDHHRQVTYDKETLVAASGLSPDDLQSSDKLALTLEAMGVEPPMKMSPTTNKLTWAFSKSDAAFTDLLDHENPVVQAIIAARLGVKSTLEETRSQRFINIATATYDGQRSHMPVPLRFSGAHTHRFGGDWKLNLQNLPSRKSTKLREALIAPEGYDVVTVDSSQIEARLAAWLCGADTIVKQFASKDDVYSRFAERVYNYSVSKKTHPKERFVGKESVLGLGFGMGPPKFLKNLQIKAFDLGMDLGDFDENESRRVVGTFRTVEPNYQRTWRFLDDMLNRMYRSEAEGVRFGPCTFENDAILLPSGLRLFYHGLKYSDGQWSYWYGRMRKHIYGAKMLENIVQALDRVVVMDASVRIQIRLRKMQSDYELAHQVHDELVYIVRQEDREWFQALILEEMRRPPVWGIDLPVDAETGYGPNFGKAK